MLCTFGKGGLAFLWVEKAGFAGDAGAVFLASSSSRWCDRDYAGRSGELTDSTGGTRFFLSPGVQVDLPPGLAGCGFLQIGV